jgi:hypothetical protein
MRFMGGGCGFKPIGGVNAYREEYSDTYSTWFLYANPDPIVTIRATDEQIYCSTDFGDGWDERWESTDDDEPTVSETAGSSISLKIIVIVVVSAILAIAAGVVNFFIRRGGLATSPMPAPVHAHVQLSESDGIEIPTAVLYAPNAHTSQPLQIAEVAEPLYPIAHAKQ